MFRAIVISKADDKQQCTLRDVSDSELPEGDVTLAVEYSTINYKDGLAITGKAPVVRKFPTVAACGLAGGMDFPSSVAPFILRGVTLAGIDSVMAPRALREEAWSRLARDLDQSKLDAMTREITLAEAIPAAGEILAGGVRGRLVVKVNA